MLIASKDGRKIRAMVMDVPVDRCRGIVQCGLPGCEAHMAIVEPGTTRISGLLEEATPTEQVAWFLEHHECHAPPRRQEGPPTARVAGRRRSGRRRRST
jgi:hypothetical protein